MKQAFKKTVFHIAKGLGLFALARRITAGQLRILGYHGASIRDEHQFSPGTFMTGTTFNARLKLLADMGYPILALEDALEKLKAGTLPPAATVITIDDGWYGTFAHMAPALEARGLPATLYVSSYYMEKGTQVFNMYLGYLLSKPYKITLSLADLDPGLSDICNLHSERRRRTAFKALLECGENHGNAQHRQDLLRHLSEALGIDWQEAEAARLFTYMTAEEMATLPKQGIDLELHTHRHFVPQEGSDVIVREIADNRAALEKIADGPFDHFCYPSGVHDPSHFPYLETAGIKSAVTTDAGFAYPDTHPYALPRILDSEALSLIEFEAEMSGFLEIFRWLRGRAHR